MIKTSHKILTNRQKLLSFAIALSMFLVLSGCGSSGEKKVLVFSKTAGYQHQSIPTGIVAVQQLGKENGFVVDTTSDASLFTEEILAQYSAVIFMSTTGDVLDHNQQADFERYIQAGGGYVGVHAAADTEYQWPWYNQLVGAYFLSHPAQQNATVKVLDRAHMATDHLPEEWTHFDEWYNYKSIVEGLNVLLNLDESSYEGGTNGPNHPISWYREFDGGRIFYTGLGHTNETYSDELFLQHLLGGINYAIGDNSRDYAKAISQRVPLENRFQREVLANNLNEPMELDYLPDDQILFIERAGDLKLYDLKTNILSNVAHINVDYVSEDGLLGLAVDPNYETNHWIYIFYTPKNADKLQRLSRFDLREGVLDFDSEKYLLEFPSTRECCHSGGSLEFDRQGNLYISTGDNTNPFESDGYSPSDERPGRSVWDAQKSSANTNDLRGKIIRIKPEDAGTYSIPEGNLFEDDDPKTRPEIYVMGVRNAFRISIDQKNGNLYWGDIGPDAGNNDSLRGPHGIDEINQARQPGNWGWPYTRGNNISYWDYDFANKKSRTPFDPNNLVNNSPNNTGIQNLPPAQPSFIWYPYDATGEFPWVGSGGRTAMAGPVFYKDQFDGAENRFPDYYDGKLFVYEWMRDWIFVVTMNENDEYVKAEPFMANSEFHNPIDMAFGKDGSLYILEYGESWNTRNLDAQLNKISYVEGNRAPIARISSDKTIGATPLKVQFNGEGSEDLEGSLLSYRWVFGDGLGESTEANPTFTFDQKGNFDVRLTVTDPEGLQAETVYTIAAGNNPPEISIQFDSENRFYNRNGRFGYQIGVEDLEDGNLGSGGVLSKDVKVSLAFLPNGRKEIVETGHKIEIISPGKKLIDNSDCSACHAVDRKINGPSYQEISNKYSKDQMPMLVGKIKNGGAGVWGETPMAAHPQLSDTEILEMVKYIMSFKEDGTMLTTSGSLAFNQHEKSNLKGVYVLTATYTDKGSEGVAAVTSTEQYVFKSSMLEAEEADAMHENNSFWNALGADIVGNIKSGSYLMFDEVLFDELQSVTFRGVYNDKYNYQGTIELRRGAIDGGLLGQAKLNYDEQKQSFRDDRIILKSGTGKDKLFVVFKNSDDPEKFITNPDYVLLNYKK